MLGEENNLVEYWLDIWQRRLTPSSVRVKLPLRCIMLLLTRSTVVGSATMMHCPASHFRYRFGREWKRGEQFAKVEQHWWAVKGDLPLVVTRWKGSRFWSQKPLFSASITQVLIFYLQFFADVACVLHLSFSAIKPSRQLA